MRATISLSPSFARVRRSSGVVPCQIAGRIRDSGAERERDLAIAVNGRIEAVGRSFHLKGESAESYAVMVPEDALREGRNKVEVLEVTDDGGDGSTGSQLSWPRSCCSPAVPASVTTPRR